MSLLQPRVRSRGAADARARALHSFTSEVKFAYRLFDLDGSGALDKAEAVSVLRCVTLRSIAHRDQADISRHRNAHSDAMRSDLSQYGQKAAAPKVDMSQRDSIRALVDEISNRAGSDEIRMPEFEARACRQRG